MHTFLEVSSGHGWEWKFFIVEHKDATYGSIKGTVCMRRFGSEHFTLYAHHLLAGWLW